MERVAQVRAPAPPAPSALTEKMRPVLVSYRGLSTRPSSRPPAVRPTNCPTAMRRMSVIAADDWRSKASVRVAGSAIEHHQGLMPRRIRLASLGQARDPQVVDPAIEGSGGCVYPHPLPAQFADGVAGRVFEEKRKRFFRLPLVSEASVDHGKRPVRAALDFLDIFRIAASAAPQSFFL